MPPSQVETINPGISWLSDGQFYAKADITPSPLALTVNPDKGPSREGVYRRQRMTASFMHFYFPSDPVAAMHLFLS